jgi:hypothetical protein
MSAADLHEFLSHQGMWFSDSLEGRFHVDYFYRQPPYLVINDRDFPKHGPFGTVDKVFFIRDKSQIYARCSCISEAMGVKAGSWTRVRSREISTTRML